MASLFAGMLGKGSEVSCQFTQLSVWILAEYQEKREWEKKHLNGVELSLIT